MILSLEKLLLPSPLVKWENPLFQEKAISVFIKRDDLIHPTLSGNKYRKLKFNLKHAADNGFHKLTSFGGAYSNHLYAMAGVSKHFDFKVEMFVRGDELTPTSSSTLSFASESGVDLKFVSRSAYRDKEKLIRKASNDSFVIPEGGSNAFSLLGVQEMVAEIEQEITPTHICCAIGTGGTAAGILSSITKSNFQLIGVPVLKGGSFLIADIEKLIEKTHLDRLSLLTNYHFGGYAKHTEELLKFIKDFEAETQIPLEQVYTGKLFYAIKKEIEKGLFPKESTIVLYHSGGLQGKIKKV